ncbi:MAG: hypothetical protein JO166_10865 [Deltaproteobacteria bacterium]|nr:hypothetical protein [Deltaproteobacteria bacterium]
MMDQAKQWRDWMLANGKKFIDHDAAFRTWLNKSNEVKDNKQTSLFNGHTGGEKGSRIISRIEAEYGPIPRKPPGTAYDDLTWALNWEHYCKDGKRYWRPNGVNRHWKFSNRRTQHDV